MAKRPTLTTHDRQRFKATLISDPCLSLGKKQHLIHDTLTLALQAKVHPESSSYVQGNDEHSSGDNLVSNGLRLACRGSWSDNGPDRLRAHANSAVINASKGGISSGAWGQHSEHL